MCTLSIVHVGKCISSFRIRGTNPEIPSASPQPAQYEGYFSSETGWYFIFSLPFLLILWHWAPVLVVWNRLELSSGSSDQLNQTAGPSYPILTTVPRGITLKKKKRKKREQLLHFPLRHFNHKKMFEYPINLRNFPFIIFPKENCAASCANLLSQTAGG